MGCGGRGGARDGRCRSVRPSRMVLTPPTKVSSLRSFPQVTVAIELGSPGRSRSNRKTIAQGKSDVSAGPVCSCALSTTTLHTRPRVPARIRLSLRPLTGGRDGEEQSSGESRREIAKARLDLSTSLRAQRSNPFFLFRARWIASSQGLLAMTLRERDPVALMEPTVGASRRPVGSQ